MQTIFEMKKVFLLCILVISLAFILQACNNNAEEKVTDVNRVFSDSTKYTTVQWLDTVKNFGTITMGEKIKITFRCLNTGEKQLFLSDVRPSCGCTLAEYTKEPIPPGKEGKIVAEFDSNKSHPGKLTKTIYVHTNTKNSTPPYLIFTGEIIRDESSADSTSNKHS